MLSRSEGVLVIKVLSLNIDDILGGSCTIASCVHSFLGCRLYQQVEG